MFQSDKICKEMQPLEAPTFLKWRRTMCETSDIVTLLGRVETCQITLPSLCIVIL